jgi:hypothetical protein
MKARSSVIIQERESALMVSRRWTKASRLTLLPFIIPLLLPGNNVAVVVVMLFISFRHFADVIYIYLCTNIFISRAREHANNTRGWAGPAASCQKTKSSSTLRSQPTY